MEINSSIVFLKREYRHYPLTFLINDSTGPLLKVFLHQVDATVENRQKINAIVTAKGKVFSASPPNIKKTARTRKCPI